MSGQQSPSQPPNRGGWGRMPPSPSPVPFRPASPYAPSPPPIMSARRLPGSPVSPMPVHPMSPMFGCPSPARLPPRMAAPGAPYIPCPRPRWPSPLPPGVQLPPGPRPYRLTPIQVSDTHECGTCSLICSHVCVERLFETRFKFGTVVFIFSESDARNVSVAGILLLAVSRAGVRWNTSGASRTPSRV